MFICSVFIILAVFIIGALSATVAATNSSETVSKISLPELAVSGSQVWLNCVVTSMEDVELRWMLRRQAEEVELYRSAGGGPVEIHDDIVNITDYVNHVVRDTGGKGMKTHIWSVRLRALSNLSGSHSCVASTASGKHAAHTNMLVYSPEQELCLSYEAGYEKARVKCVAHKLYPQPEMILEHNHKMIPKQELRVWLSDWYSYNAESTAEVEFIHGRVPDSVTCRLTLPTAGYTVKREELLPIPRKLFTLRASNFVDGFRILDFRLKVILTLQLFLYRLVFLQYFSTAL